MSKKFSIAEMAETVGQNKENIRRFLKRNNIKEVNTDRPYANSPKYYDFKALEKVKKEYEPISAKEQSKRHSSTTVAHDSTTKAQHNSATSDNEVVLLLKKQVEGLEEDKKALQDHQNKLAQMLEQQQHLTLIAQRKAETLELEYSKKNNDNDIVEEDKKEVKKSLFKRIFKKD